MLLLSQSSDHICCLYSPACCPRSSHSSSVIPAQWRNTDYKQLSSSQNLLKWVTINVSFLLLSPTQSSNTPHIINALPLASVAELAFNLWVLCFDPVATPQLYKHDERGHLWLWERTDYTGVSYILIIYLLFQSKLYHISYLFFKLEGHYLLVDLS